MCYIADLSVNCSITWTYYTYTRCLLRCSTVFYLEIVNFFAGVMTMAILVISQRNTTDGEEIDYCIP